MVSNEIYLIILRTLEQTNHQSHNFLNKKEIYALQKVVTKVQIHFDLVFLSKSNLFCNTLQFLTLATPLEINNCQLSTAKYHSSMRLTKAVSIIATLPAFLSTFVSPRTTSFYTTPFTSQSPSTCTNLEAHQSMLPIFGCS